MAYLATIELAKDKGQQIGVVLKSNDAPTMISYVWMGHDTRYFHSAVPSLSMGKPYSIIR